MADMNEKLVTTVIKPMVDEMEDETGMVTFEDLAKNIEKANAELTETLNESTDLFMTTIDALYSNDLSAYDENIARIQGQGIEKEFKDYALRNYGLTDESINLCIAECMASASGSVGGGATTVANGGGFSAQLGTAPTVTGVRFLDKAVEGESSKKKKKKKVDEAIEVGKCYKLKGMDFGDFVKDDDQCDYKVLGMNDETVVCERQDETKERYFFNKNHLIDPEKPTETTTKWSIVTKKDK